MPCWWTEQSQDSIWYWQIHRQWKRRESRFLCKQVVFDDCHSKKYLFFFKNAVVGASLVVQRLRIHLPVQGMLVQPLVREHSTCQAMGPTKPVPHNRWACAPEPESCNFLWLPRPCTRGAQSLYFAAREATTMINPHNTKKSSPHPLQLEKACAQQRRPSAAKSLKKKKKKRMLLSRYPYGNI